MQTLSWIVVLPVLALVILAIALGVRKMRQANSQALPTDWALTARPVFSTDERRVYRLLREALPHHIVLSKLPLVRFCQPANASEVQYWYQLLGTNHVAFAVCSPNGRVLAAIDLDNERGVSPRVTEIKQSVLSACRVRHLRCPVDRLPTIAELQLLVPQHTNAARGPQPAPTLDAARDSLANTVATRRAQRTALWQDSTFFHDSFFAMDSRLDGLGSDFGSLGALEPANGQPASSLDARLAGAHHDRTLGGVVVDVDVAQPPPRAARH